ncbi:hypothetical protein PspLS_04012 [Pyricularia sp. CBS 133598]|nr:hypothetical protein PspLS_04012 [Pyricularia sp. CBS 133598]
MAAVGTQSHRAENEPTGLDIATAQFRKVDKDGRDDSTCRIDPDRNLSSIWDCSLFRIGLK